MSSVDNRIVSMKFDNASFEKGVSTTLGSLAKLKESLSFSGANKGMAELQASAGRFNLGTMEGAVTGVSKSFLALSTIAITALSQIASKALQTGTDMVKSLSGVQAMADGFADYERKIGATQTIMAGTGENIDVVSKHLKELDIYADKTIYSLSDMTSNIGKFTNAGVKLPVAVKAMTGIANAAALSGANAEEASRAMYNLGQAIGQGTVRLMDWKSVELANMGTKEFKEQLIEAAIATGSLKKGVDGAGISAKGTKVDFKSFSSTLAEGWLTSEALVKTLGNYADETTDIGKRSYAAATEVKTFSMMMETLKAAAGTGWTDTFEIVIGTLPEATKRFTAITNVIGGFIEKSAESRNKILKDWKELGGRAALFDGVKNIFESLSKIVSTVKDAFRDIFPKITGQRLTEITTKFRDFTERLKIGEDVLNNLKRTFRGVFAIFSIIKQVITGVAGVFGQLFSAFNIGSVNILGLTGGISDFLVRLDETLKEGDKLANFFEKLGTVIAAPIRLIQNLKMALFAIVTGGTTPFLEELSTRFAWLGPAIDNVRTKIQEITTALKSGLGPVMQEIGEKIQDIAAIVGTGLSGLGNLFGFGDSAESAAENVSVVQASLNEMPSLLDRVQSAWDSVVQSFKSVGSFLAPALNALKELFSGIKDKLVSFIKDLNVEDAIALINTGFFIALYRTLKGMADKYGGLIDSYKGAIDSFGGVLDQVTGNLKTMQTSIRAEIIQKIAIALAALAAAIFILSKVDADRLAASLGAVAIMLTELVAALIVLEKTTSLSGAGKLTALSVAFVALGIGLAAMAASVKIFGTMKPEELVQGLKAIGIVLGGIVVATALLNASGGSSAILGAAVAMGIMAGSLLAFAAAVKLYSMLDPVMLLDGGLKIAATLIAIGLAMRAFPKNILGNAAGLVIMAGALLAISAALKVFSKMSSEEAAQAIGMLAKSLIIIALALRVMNGAAAGAASILLFAAALNLLIPPLVIFSKLKPEEIGSALLAIAGVFGVLGVAALVLGPVVPIILALGASILLLGAGALVAGTGLFLFALGLASLAASGTAGIAALTATIIAVSQLFPLIMQQVGHGIRAFAKVMQESAPVFRETFRVIMENILQGIIDVAPKIRETFGVILDNMIQNIVDSADKFWRAGLELLTNFLNGLADNIGQVIDAGTRLITEWIAAMGRQAKEIAKAAAKAILEFIDGISKAIDDNAEELGAAGGRLAKAIVKGLSSGLLGGAGEIATAAKGMATGALGSITKFFKIDSPSKVMIGVGRDIDEGLAIGLTTYSSVVDKAAIGVSNTTLDTMKSTMAQISEIVAGDIDMTPVISPVLDLTQVQQQAGRLSSMLPTSSIQANVSTNQASTIARSQEVASTTTPDTTPVVSSAPIVFEQKNYSPKALDSIEIYRNTKNLMSLAKEALNS
jgi:Tape measure protein